MSTVTDWVYVRHLALMALDDDYAPPLAVTPDGDGGYVEKHRHECARWTVHRDAELGPVSLEVDYIDPYTHPGWLGDDWAACLVDHAGGVGIAVTRLSDDASVIIMPDGTGGLLDAISDLHLGMSPLRHWEDGLGRSLPQAMHEMMLALHSTGWRPHERDYIQREYDLNDAEVDLLCEMMQDAIDDGELPMYDANYTREDDDDDAA